MKLKITAIAMLLVVLMTGCQKEEITPAKTTVKIQLDYLEAGGYYNDNISGVPSGLVLGTNGPFEIEPDIQYHIQYRASSNFPEVTIDWTPSKGKNYVIHGYVSGNYEHIEANPE